ncbi:hypothetical protein A0H81_11662 [Grifola frondosa]|uniref:Uncharacterized protein n=1 Tax=Grifola frondosa TaxID=5627 RepID=A0A1C7LUS2_GRIFR|nr:hypothetical protein A0H81_11662 [Grifola frondosa]
MQSQSSYSGGYSQAPPGTRAVDAYYNASPSTPANAYPPTRQGSAHTQSASGYAASTYSYNNAPAAAAGAVAATSRQYGQYGQYGHQQQPTTTSNVYGHTGGGSSYHSTAAQPYQTNYSVPTSDPFTAQPSSQPVFNPDTYNSTGYMHPSSPSTSANPTNNPYRGQSAYVRPLSPPERNYTLGGGGYGTNVVPDATADFPQYTSSPTSTYHTIPSPAPINTSVSPAPSTASPRATQHSNVVQSTIHEEQRSDESYSDSPPMYDAATSQPAGAWGAKH